MNGGHTTTGLDLFFGGHVFDERGENIGPKQGLVFHYGTYEINVACGRRGRPIKHVALHVTVVLVHHGALWIAFTVHCIEEPFVGL